MADRVTSVMGSAVPLTRGEWVAWFTAGFLASFTVTFAAARWVERRWPGS